MSVSIVSVSFPSPCFIILPSNMSHYQLMDNCTREGAREYACVWIILRSAFQNEQRFVEAHRLAQELEKKHNGGFDRDLYWRSIWSIKSYLDSQRRALDYSSWSSGYPGGLPG